MHFIPLGNSRAYYIEMKSKIHNRWISISNIFFSTILIVIFAACVTQGTCLHCKYAELNKKQHILLYLKAKNSLNRENSLCGHHFSTQNIL